MFVIMQKENVCRYAHIMRKENACRYACSMRKKARLESSRKRRKDCLQSYRNCIFSYDGNGLKRLQSLNNPI
ncbi:hypothetical protein ACS0TY_031980 [Phlomoides rotata]